jgi:hypothetical protein
MYKGTSIRITAGFSRETLKTIRAWIELFETLKENQT